jgi:uncharacterized membrane protein
MKVCEEIRQSIVVDVPAKAANAEWTQFIFWNFYHHPVGGPDETEAQPDSGFVRLEAVDDHSTRVTVDLNYCPHYEGLSDAEEIAQTQKHLLGTLARYKEFVESRQA